LGHSVNKLLRARGDNSSDFILCEDMTCCKTVFRKVRARSTMGCVLDGALKSTFAAARRDGQSLNLTAPLKKKNLHGAFGCDGSTLAEFALATLVRDAAESSGLAELAVATMVLVSPTSHGDTRSCSVPPRASSRRGSKRSVASICVSTHLASSGQPDRLDPTWAALLNLFGQPVSVRLTVRRSFQSVANST
jgi:hypothetical protein